MIYLKYTGAVILLPFLNLLMCIGENAAGGYTREEGPQAGKLAWIWAKDICRIPEKKSDV